MKTANAIEINLPFYDAIWFANARWKIEVASDAILTTRNQHVLTIRTEVTIANEANFIAKVLLRRKLIARHVGKQSMLMLQSRRRAQCCKPM